MKNEKYLFALHYWHIFILAYFLIIPVACRSNKDLHKVSESVTETQSSASTQSKDSTVTTTNTRDSTSNITTEKQYIRTTWYRPDGTIRKIQEEGREVERTELAVHDTGSSAVSVAEQKTDSTKKVNRKKLETEQLKAFTDSRPIQGSEWIAVMAVIIGAIYLMVVYYLPKKKKE